MPTKIRMEQGQPRKERGRRGDWRDENGTFLTSRWAPIDNGGWMQLHHVYQSLSRDLAHALQRVDPICDRVVVNFHRGMSRF